MGDQSEPTLLERAANKFGELNPAEKKLFTLAQERFKELSDSEYELFRAIANGELIDYRTGNDTDDKPENAADWGKERVLRSDRIRWICIEPEVWKLCLPQGLDIAGAKIEGSLNLSFSDIEIPLRFSSCCFAEVLRLQQAKLRRLDLSGSHIAASEIEIVSGQKRATSIDARQSNVAGSIWLRDGFQASGTVILQGASIGGVLTCEAGKFINESGPALLAEGVNVTGSVFLRNGFEAKGIVSLLGASIGRNLECDKGTFTNESGDALLAEGVNVTGFVSLRNGFEAKGRVSLLGTSIGGNLSCDKGTFINESGDALLAGQVNVTGSVFLRNGFEAKGRVSLLSATIGGDLDCGKGTFTNESGDALFAQSIDVKGFVFLRNGFEAKGRVSLLSATIGGNLECDKGTFTNESGDALFAQSIDVKGSVFLRNDFQANGRVSLAAATIEGILSCDKGTFTNEGKDALFAQSTNVTGSVFLNNGFQAKGRINLVDARIGNTLQIAGVKAPEEMLLNLQFAKVQTLDHAEDSFPALGKLLLNGLVYEALGRRAPQKWDRHLKWLRLQPIDSFSSQPYEQLAKVLRSTGYGDEATRVLIGREDDQLRYGKLGRFGKSWKWFLGKTIDYGYRPQRALLWALLVILFGSFVFSRGYENGLIAPTERGCDPSKEGPIFDCPNYPHYPKFDPVVYSLDVFLPIIDLRLKNAWLPNAEKGNTEDRIFHLKSGAWLRYYFWFQIISGWALTTLWVAGFTGLVRSTNK